MVLALGEEGGRRERREGGRVGCKSNPVHDFLPSPYESASLFFNYYGG
jgi:hypothetical protein